MDSSRLLAKTIKSVKSIHVFKICLLFDSALCFPCLNCFNHHHAYDGHMSWFSVNSSYTFLFGKASITGYNMDIIKMSYVLNKVFVYEGGA